MGRGSYTSDDWSKLKSSRGISDEASADHIFTNRGINEKYDPKFIDMREARDNEDSPESTPVILAFDVTGSMGYLAKEIAANSLNKTITELYSKQPVTNPQIMCAAIGDTSCDSAPLQVTQFETDIRVVEQLLDLWLEGRGGDEPESYNAPWYFAARHTKIDSFDKRGKKGFLFTIGDASCRDDITAHDIKRVFSDDVANDFSSEELYAMASERYNVFHICVKKTITPFSETLKSKWEKLMPGHVAFLDDIKNLSDVVIAIMMLTAGRNKDDILSQTERTDKETVKKAIANLTI